MSYLSLSQYARLNDSLERRLVSDALERYEPVSLSEVFSTLLDTVRTVARYIGDVFTAMDDAREADVRFTGSHW